ncbi:MAG: hypothetical protein COZ27_03955 [Candidatus Moranbacteria bacterium CG_4_10_14_3_um_filter_41_65]|nr:MAG: hypothetical protein AUK58_04355 [Candidatus Moranbacteria bacterium CG2_30_41_165]PIP25838.1 MAG: hypothetical protein COX32_01305 [Candidatus Moranbacteria bacterium CG23_combo_of_CG06-09_8_20_14_all_41_28]PIV85877.1 MAG: hypothetical protein COW50_04670 [Candidatus Moranbacteria bacterium CG17_big_fil_post_rev_8_21_14_2_50_41_107]PIW93896.1 MAG: hypothetical protein COZ86_04050 [Candidatus Moranbacteria bacterium CG_4_8_14_3_um_filter_41_13]PIX91208.1 MAG: hypothetical protein COZ27_
MAHLIPFEPGMEGNFIPYEVVEGSGLMILPEESLCTRCRDIILGEFKYLEGEYFYSFCMKKEQLPPPKPIRIRI